MKPILASILYFGLLLVSLYVLMIGPIKDIFRDETVFTESYQNINGNSKISWTLTGLISHYQFIEVEGCVIRQILRHCDSDQARENHFYMLTN